ncbi:TetR/AcrR family transcriptional regulator [Gordonia sp. HY002]|uniref:TetR/AcrR family transcriptional regulator n=1 Tax=Gordonia zhenghanii TaxID=2911516 RepID=UPI001EF0E47E|nr:TetR/AcrR family transcriptional regulator [Gordonia zhenghanii]MCF8572073.1 TetR/AcrR family transcriptional regulator [Gordonia zhenghanii]MCF8602947.1 TetR/AcrR family transcriptional regulator [Gordonia zhenghanii]MCF8605677.1 TetR/AcrR family transcriptional regulator [Gordonia zhenghanii]
MVSKSELTRARLQDGAMASFAEHGFHGTSTRHIAAAAGMSPAAVYVHFSSKEELLFEITRTGHLQILEIVTAAADSALDSTTRLANIVREFVIYHAQHHVSSRVVNYELTRLDPEHLAEIVAIRVQIDRALTGVLEGGIADGEFTVGDVAMTTTAISSLGVDVSRWFRDGRTWSPESVGDYYAGLALAMVDAR